MLYTDSDVITSDLLLSLDSEVSDVASAQGINLNDIMRAAWNECADLLFERMDSFGGQVNLLPGNISTLDYMGVSRSRVFLSQIVTNTSYGLRTSALLRWMTYHALVLFYRDASARLEKDRYEKKVAKLERDERSHAKSLWRKGLPIVQQPLPCPGSIHELNSGTWGASNLSAVNGGINDPLTYDVAITWVDGSKYVSQTNKGNAESGPSAVLTFPLPSNKMLAVDTSTLAPPGRLYGSGSYADGVLSTLTATGWNVYAAVTGQTLRLQNAAPIAIGTTSYTFAPTMNGARIDPGQLPDANYSFENILQRA